MSCRFLVVGFLAISGSIAFASDCARCQETPAVLAHMVGKWTVTERMWPGSDAAPIPLPDASAERRIVGVSLVEETMVAVSGSKSSFTRIADLKSRGDAALAGESDQRAVRLYGGTFVAPQWGKLKNASFKYRLVLGPVQRGRQIVQLYFTPQSGPSTTEFLAFEYAYEKYP